MKIPYLLLRLYPRRWRERYEEEMIELLKQHHVTPITCFDLFLGALDARFDPHYKSERSLFPGGSLSMSVLVFISSFILYSVVLGTWQSLMNPISLTMELPIYETVSVTSKLVQVVTLLFLPCITFFFMARTMKRAWVERKRRRFFILLGGVLLPFLVTIGLLFSLRSIGVPLISGLPMLWGLEYLFCNVLLLVFGIVDSVTIRQRRLLLFAAIFFVAVMAIQFGARQVYHSSLDFSTLIGNALYTSVYPYMVLALGKAQPNRKNLKLMLITGSVLFALLAPLPFLLLLGTWKTAFSTPYYPQSIDALHRFMGVLPLTVSFSLAMLLFLCIMLVTLFRGYLAYFSRKKEIHAGQPGVQEQLQR
uniref:Uncharacterized protein n=1 Tax=Thermosporothrix sp. COM3 TaxID=2490863 RepID=A0A455SJ66_9CHLR|nr:hypothetical protein KTC_21120 [Thermosporothrix sp. COM3]